MNPKNLSVATLSGFFAVLVGLIVLAGCGGSSSSSTTTPTGTPEVSLSVPSLTFSSGVGVASAAQSVTVTDSGTATVTFSGIAVSSNFSQTNTCGTSIGEGSTCTVSVTFTPTAASTVSGTLTITDNAGTQTVTLSGTGSGASVSPSSLTFSGVTVGTTSAAQSVTLTNASASALTITSITITAGSPIFYLATLPTPTPTNYCGTSVAANSTCVIYGVTFAPTTAGTFNGTLTIIDNAGTQTVALTGSNTFANQTPVSVNFGPNGNTGSPATNYYNGIFTTVTVCQPGTTTCVPVPNVLVDTGSVGLRVLSSALTGVTLAQINDGNGDNLNECTEYGDGSFNWGPVSLATVQIGGETASQVPAVAGGTANSGVAIQIISADTVPTAVQGSGQCVVPSGSTPTDTPDEYTVTTLGANGILGIGTEPQDCSYGGTNYCSTAAGLAQITDFYWLCTTAGVCEESTVPLPDQVWNPIAAFSSSDTNGAVLSLPAIPAAGQATVAGTLTFGIGTATNNAISNTATVYELDIYDYFGSSTYNGITSTSETSYGTFLDSGSNGLFISDDTTLGTTDCTVGGVDIYYYCPASTLNLLPLTLTGTNNTSGTFSLSVENALNLFDANPSFAAFNDLAGPSGGTNTSTDSWDLGLPFFFGRTIYFGIAGTTYPTAGYYAF